MQGDRENPLDDTSEFFEERANASDSTRKNKGGRPSPIDDEILFSRRDYLIQMLSDSWGEIGWELSCARTAAQLSRTFGSLSGSLQHQFARYLQCLSTAETMPASASDIRSARRLLGELVKRKGALVGAGSYTCPNRVAEAEEKLRLSGNALVSTSNQDTLLGEHLRNLSAYRKIKAEAFRLKEELKATESRLARQETYYAQHEILKFISSSKYAHNPRNLAYAMAGLPEIGCWQSFQRCEKHQSELWPMHPHEMPTRSYSIFRIIEKSCDAKYDTSRSNLLELLKKEVGNVPHEFTYVGSYLRQNWRYLRLAVKQIDLKDTSPPAVPYRIFARFVIEVGKPRSPEECVLAECESQNFDV